MRLHNRMIKASFWTDTDLLRHLDRDGRMFYIGLIQLADDSGCLEDDLLAFKIHLYPADMDVDLDFIQKHRDRLVELGKLIPYTSEGKQCLYLKNFHKHQSLRSPAPPSVPLPEWITWEPGETARSSGKYIVSEPYGDRTVTVSSPYGDQPEPEPELEPEPEEKRTRREEELKDSPNPPGPDPSPASHRPDDSQEPKYTEDSMPYRAALYLREHILRNNSRARVPPADPKDKLMQKWAAEMDKLNRIGPPGADPGGDCGYSWAEIRKIIDWCQNDDFWSANILSPAKLRKQITVLENQMKRQYGREPPGAKGMTMSKNVANALRLVEKYSQEKGDYP